MAEAGTLKRERSLSNTSYEQARQIPKKDHRVTILISERMQGLFSEANNKSRTYIVYICKYNFICI